MEKECKNCYIEVKRWTIIRGILVTIILQMGMMVPFFNIYFLYLFYLDGQEKPKEGFCETIWYEIKKIKVNKR